MSGPELDVVLFGATGFVGALTAAHLAEAAGDARVALAGRSEARLTELRAGLGPGARDWELVAVDASDSDGLQRLAARTRVLASTVGPYAVLGREVVLAAARQGTHYADLTGEASFLAWSLATAAGPAAESGARIVHSCGFDSIPSDLAVWLLTEQAVRDGSGRLTEATLVVRSLRGGLSGGTIDSLRQEVIAAASNREVRQVLRDPYSALPTGTPRPGAGRTGLSPRLRRLLPVERDSRTGRWLGPFVMAGYNTRIVRLSRALAGHPDPAGLPYRELSDVGAGPAGPVRAIGMGLGLAAVTAGLAWGPSRALIDRVLPRPGEGPDADQRAAGHFRMEITASTSSGARYLATVAADRDPGYNGTAVMLGQSALSLATDGDALPQRAGVLTPSTALGGPLVERLRGQGFTLAVERLD